ncbi:pyridoxamine 5'-phosphate oxidase family protein [Paludicola sp. MB14-C6]|uniref:pyridoxamine 5'-phosphate oxidase family protein n=1 Tax=Paludihabitans sp. MB14-C6 TaxID=3070656 RepID=UPI0027DCE8BA|nr:pyridoxamine 5'-phosphate oxidase family protein [Paludicola sp. MB14-C6]WMJ23866.1 pyridoxamine 5'-phosphate oxidase family protein [Paludicola sp. MB14-C6]
MNYFNDSLIAMQELYGHDIPMSLATVSDGKPNARVVNVYYKDKSFYITSYALTNKVKEIIVNPNVALNHNLFVAHGTAVNIGNPLENSNKGIRDELKEVFSAFYNKHVNEQDPYTCIIKIELEDALVFANNFKYCIDFVNETATREDCVVDIV